MASSNFIPDISLMQRRRAHMQEGYLRKSKGKARWPQSRDAANASSALGAASHKPLTLPSIDDQNGGALATDVSPTRFNIIQKHARTQANSRQRQRQ